ncbi:autotransporter outer membrane beta-barrel domain-containing protein [Candidatus Regiella insecticola]|uniref:autotransporter outer membrane beta-barrel domain-containing protein n=1 Tax=Candidatus Regiella insecticola TaxID=138073 RepID=UPI0002EAA597|nr:autotransporter domain-containing protein [Candidatus Regiella insecticola]
MNHILSSHSPLQARRLFKHLSGQVHADAASTQINASRHVREAVKGRLLQANSLLTSSDIKTDDNGVWGQFLNINAHSFGDNNATGYQASTRGVLLGVDTPLIDDWRFGIATGFTHSKMNNDYGSSADSDNYHLALYLGQQFGSWSLRGGVASAWHNFDTSRSIEEAENAKYTANTRQIFAETSYRTKTHETNLEPFANLTYINFQSNTINEQGSAAALHGSKQHKDEVLSTIGLRGERHWLVSKTAQLTVRGELGWQHQYGELARGKSLKFQGSNRPFTVNSVPVARDSAVIKVSAKLPVSTNTSVSLGYAGLLSQHHKENSVNASLSWRF